MRKNVKQANASLRKLTESKGKSGENLRGKMIWGSLRRNDKQEG